MPTVCASFDLPTLPTLPIDVGADGLAVGATQPASSGSEQDSGLDFLACLFSCLSIVPMASETPPLPSDANNATAQPCEQAQVVSATTLSTTLPTLDSTDTCASVPQGRTYAQFLNADFKTAFDSLNNTVTSAMPINDAAPITSEAQPQPFNSTTSDHATIVPDAANPAMREMTSDKNPMQPADLGQQPVLTDAPPVRIVESAKYDPAMRPQADGGIAQSAKSDNESKHIPFTTDLKMETTSALFTSVQQTQLIETKLVSPLPVHAHRAPSSTDLSNHQSATVLAATSQSDFTPESIRPGHESRPASLPEQIRSTFHTHLERLQQYGRVEVQLNLHPPELGRMQLHISMKDNQIDVRMVVQNDAAKQVLDQQAEPLRVHFSEMGISLGQLDVRRDGQAPFQQPPPDAESAPSSAQGVGRALPRLSLSSDSLTIAVGRVDVMA
jgi:flagellar hook-length control protein FliK